MLAWRRRGGLKPLAHVLKSEHDHALVAPRRPAHG
jgi:hypothetical protein